MASPEPQVQIQNNFTEVFLIIPSTKIAQMVPLHTNKRAAKALGKEHLQRTSSDPLDQVQNIFTEIFLMMPSTEIALTVQFGCTKWPPVLKKEISLNDISDHRPKHHLLMYQDSGEQSRSLVPSC